jgi:hypothetical protein
MNFAPADASIEQDLDGGHINDPHTNDLQVIDNGLVRDETDPGSKQRY